MSRTRKDAPWRVRQNRAVKRGVTSVRHGCGHAWNGAVVECDAHRTDIRHGHRNCDPLIDGRHREWDPYGKTSRERRARYWAPERMAVASSLREMTQQAHVDPHEVEDTGAVVQQHRHATWGGGWWD